MSLHSTNSQDIEICRNLQAEEWEVIQSIYPDYISNENGKGIFKLEVPIELPEPTHILTGSDREVMEITTASAQIPSLETMDVQLTSLPPILVEFMLPSLYPLHNPPIIISLHATHSWLPEKVLELQDTIAGMWQKGEGALYNWIEWLRSGEFLRHLELTTEIDGKHYTRISHPTPHLLLPLLVVHDHSMQQLQFSQTSYNCEICLSSIKGIRCVRLACDHVFCRPCLQEFWGLSIAEGDVSRVGCPDPHCVKHANEATEEEVRRVVTEEEVQRWKWLRRKRLFEKDPTMVYCPVSFCQAPVPRPSGLEEGTGWERLRSCPECDFTFCAFCRRTWHGPISDCPLTSTESFVLEYISLAEDAPERDIMERQYGKANLRRLVAKYKEDQANKQWLDESTMSCPSCHVKVEKSAGCNHMTCAKCGQHFCYRCGDKLMGSNPYMHFSTPGMPCFSKLFDYQSVENDWQPVEGFDAL